MAFGRRKARPATVAAEGRDRALTGRTRALVKRLRFYDRERADLRGFGYPRFTDASCPHSLGSDVELNRGGSNCVRNVNVRGPARPVPEVCRRTRRLW